MDSQHAILHKELSQKVIGCFFKVYNTLGFGFSEKVYEKSLFLELQKAGLKVTRQQEINVYYDGELVGEYRADIIVEDKILLELKASANGLVPEFEAQVINYLKATEIEVSYLLNFGWKPVFLRRVFSNSNKKFRME
jgi:GxxExxY protein